MYTKCSSEFSRRICNKLIRTKLPFLSLPGLRISNLSVKKASKFFKENSGFRFPKKIFIATQYRWFPYLEFKKKTVTSAVVSWQHLFCKEWNHQSCITVVSREVSFLSLPLFLSPALAVFTFQLINLQFLSYNVRICPASGRCRYQCCHGAIMVIAETSTEINEEYCNSRGSGKYCSSSLWFSSIC